MRIGLTIYGSLDTLTGGYLYDKIIVDNLRNLGDKVEVFSLPNRSYLQHLNDNFSRHFYRDLHQARLDVLLQDELNHPSLFLLNRRLKEQVGYPRVTIVHLLRSTESRSGLGNALSRWVEVQYLNSVEGVIFNSQDSQTLVQSMIGSARPGIVAYPGRDHLSLTLSRQDIENRAVESGPLRILFIGNLIRRKGLHVLLQALAPLDQAHWTLRVIGGDTFEPKYARKVRKQIVDAGLSQNVELLGSMPSSQISDHLSSSQVLAVPSSYEGFGIVYLEALGAGLPVIASAAGGAREIIRHGRDGFLVPPEDPVAVREAIITLMEQTNLRKMSLEARDRHFDFPTWAETTQRIRAFLFKQINGTIPS